MDLRIRWCQKDKIVNLHGCCDLIWPQTNNHIDVAWLLSLTVVDMNQSCFVIRSRFLFDRDGPDVFHWFIYENDHRVARSEQLTRAIVNRPVIMCMLYSMQCHVMACLIMRWIEIESEEEKINSNSKSKCYQQCFFYAFHIITRELAKNVSFARHLWTCTNDLIIFLSLYRI